MRIGFCCLTEKLFQQIALIIRTSSKGFQLRNASSPQTAGIYAPECLCKQKPQRAMRETSPGRLTKRITPRTRACTKQRNLIKRGPRPGPGPGLDPGLGPGLRPTPGLGRSKTSSFTSPSGRGACCGMLDYPACVNCYNSIPLQIELRQVELSPSTCSANAKLSFPLNCHCSAHRGVCFP